MRFLFAFAFLVFSPVAHANDVQSLLENCRAPAGTDMWMYCAGRINGASDVMLIAGVLHSSQKQNAPLTTFAMCTKDGRFPEYAARLQAFLLWANEHPEHWNDGETTGVVIAMRERWPCR